MKAWQLTTTGASPTSIYNQRPDRLSDWCALLNCDANAACLSCHEAHQSVSDTAPGNGKTQNKPRKLLYKVYTWKEMKAWQLTTTVVSPGSRSLWAHAD